MEVTEHSAPRSHVVVDDLLPPAAQARLMAGLHSLRSRLSVGMMRAADGSFLKSAAKENDVIFLDGSARGTPAGDVLDELCAAVWSGELLDALEQGDEPLFHVLQYTEAPSLQVSRYGPGDHYGTHRDVGNKTNITVLYFACAEPRPFTGGDLVLEHRGVEKTLEFRNNRLVLFASDTLHRVTPVSSSSERFEDGRFSLQIWPAIAPGKRAEPRSMARPSGDDPARHPALPVFAAPTAELAQVEGWLRATFSGQALATGEWRLEAVHRLVWRLTTNLEFLARAHLGKRAFRSRVATLPARGPEAGGLWVFLEWPAEGFTLRLGYRLEAFPRAPLAAQLCATLEAGGAVLEERAGIDLAAGDEAALVALGTALDALLARQEPPGPCAAALAELARLRRARG